MLGVDALIKRWIAFGERSAVAGSGVPSPAGKTTLLNVRPKPPRQNVAAADPAGGVKMYVKKAKAGSSSGSGGGKTSAASPPKAKRTSKKLAAKKKKGKRGSDDEYDDDGDEEDSWGEDNYRP